MNSSPIKLKQKLSPKAAAAKKKRDIAAAKTPKRKLRKRQNQKIGQRSYSDLHHKSDGSVVRMTIKIKTMPKFQKNPNPFMKMKKYGQGKNPILFKSPMKDSGAEYNKRTIAESPHGTPLSPSTIKAHDEGHRTQWDADHNDLPAEKKKKK